MPMMNQEVLYHSAIPHVTSLPIAHTSFKYLILMTSGVYKTLERLPGDVKLEGNHIIVTMIEQQIAENGWSHTVALDVLKRIRQIQYDWYQ